MGFFTEVDAVGVAENCVSIATNGYELVIPFCLYGCDPVVIDGEFDRLSDDLLPGGVIEGFKPQAITRVSLNNQNLILENYNGVQLLWRVYRRN